MPKIHSIMFLKALLAFLRVYLLPSSSFVFLVYLIYNVFAHDKMIFNSATLTFSLIGFFISLSIISFMFIFINNYSSFFIAKNYYIGKDEETFNVNYFKYIPLKSFIAISIDKKYNDELRGYTKKTIDNIFNITLCDKNGNVINYKSVEILKAGDDDFFFTIKPKNFFDRFKVKELKIKSEKKCIIHITYSTK